LQTLRSGNRKRQGRENGGAEYSNWLIPCHGRAEEKKKGIPDIAGHVPGMAGKGNAVKAVRQHDETASRNDSWGQSEEINWHCP